MRNLLIGVLLILGLLSFNTYESRSKAQVIISGSDIADVKRQINTYYKIGYRVVFMTAQSVSTSNSIAYGERIKGDFLIIMEK